MQHVTQLQPPLSLLLPRHALRQSAFLAALPRRFLQPFSNIIAPLHHCPAASSIGNMTVPQHLRPATSSPNRIINCEHRGSRVSSCNWPLVSLFVISVSSLIAPSRLHFLQLIAACQRANVCMSDTNRGQRWRAPGRGLNRAKSGGRRAEGKLRLQLQNQLMRCGGPPRLGPTGGSMVQRKTVALVGPMASKAISLQMGNN